MFAISDKKSWGWQQLYDIHVQIIKAIRIISEKRQLSNVILIFVLALNTQCKIHHHAQIPTNDEIKQYIPCHIEHEYTDIKLR